MKQQPEQMEAEATNKPYCLLQSLDTLAYDLCVSLCDEKTDKLKKNPHQAV